MTVALWCVIAAGLLPIICAAIAKGTGKGFDNTLPRDWLSRQQGLPGRAQAAQQNSWEAFAFFSACVFTAHLAGGPQPRVDTLALAFVVTRVVYIGCYVANQAMLRSIVWTVGLGLALAIVLSGA